MRIQVLDDAEDDLQEGREFSKRFPFGVYYRVEDAVIRIYAVLDLRRNPSWIRRRLTTGEG